MRRLMRVATRSGCSRATSRADWPTTASPSAGKRTALGVSISPSRLGSVTGWPWSSSVATAQERGAQVDADQFARAARHVVYPGEMRRRDRKALREIVSGA